MTPRNIEFESATSAALGGQPLADHLGIALSGIGAGWFETVLPIQRFHLQHDGIVHGGVLATLADLGLALAAHTLVAAGERVVTVEFKINYLRAVIGASVRCRADVLRPGKSVTVSEASLWVQRDGNEILVAKAMGTIAILPVI
jgi:uncharacterized protein (TIGR00369 family)